MTRLAPLLVVLCTVLFTLAPVPQASAEPSDYDTDSGHFFTQTNGSPDGKAIGGYLISDDDGVPFWRFFQQAGGVPVLGYPISRRFSWDGFTCQALQRGVLQWDPTRKQVALMNTLDVLSGIGLDKTLHENRMVPLPLDATGEAGLDAAQVTSRRIGLLSKNQKIQATYTGVKDPLTLFGLPTSEVVDVGQALAVRFQRGVMYQWKDAKPWAKAGDVTLGNVGEFVKEAGLLPAEVVVPEPAAPAARAQTASRAGVRPGSAMDGTVTWYGADFQGRLMSNGQPYNMYNPNTAACNSHPLGTKLRITNTRNGRSVVVQVTDRGGFRYPMLADLSYAAFSQIANPPEGVVPARVEVVD